VWNYAEASLRLDVVDAVGSSEAARLTDDHVRLIGDRTLGDGRWPPSQLSSMLTETARQYVERELNRFACDVVPALFDVLAARHALRSVPPPAYFNPQCGA